MAEPKEEKLPTIFALQQARANGESLTLTSEQATEVLAVLGNLGAAIEAAEAIMVELQGRPEVFSALPNDAQEAITAWLAFVERRRANALRSVASAMPDDTVN